MFSSEKEVNEKRMRRIHSLKCYLRELSIYINKLPDQAEWFRAEMTNVELEIEGIVKKI